MGFAKRKAGLFVTFRHGCNIAFDTRIEWANPKLLRSQGLTICAVRPTSSQKRGRIPHPSTPAEPPIVKGHIRSRCHFGNPVTRNRELRRVDFGSGWSSEESSA